MKKTLRFPVMVLAAFFLVVFQIPQNVVAEDLGARQRQCPQVTRFVNSVPRAPLEIAKNVIWSGSVDYTSTSEGGLYWQADLTSDFKVQRFTIDGIFLDGTQSCTDQLRIAKKELLGAAAAMSWLSDNPWAYKNMSQMNLLADGLAALNQYREVEPLLKSWDLYPRSGLPGWDGKSKPECSHIQSIVEMRELDVILGDASLNILVDFGCMSPTIEVPGGKPDSPRRF